MRLLMVRSQNAGACGSVEFAYLVTCAPRLKIRDLTSTGRLHTACSFEIWGLMKSSKIAAIKIAVAVAPAEAAPSAFVVWRGIEESVRKAARMGYDGVELALKTADDVEPARIKNLLADHGLACPCISTGQVFAALNLYFTIKDRAKRQETLRIFKGLIDLAAGLEAMVNIGRARGFIDAGESRSNAEERFGEIALELVSYATPKRVGLVLEPVNRYEINFINSVEEGVLFLRKLKSPGMTIMADLFHMNIEDRSIAGVLQQYSNDISYIHFADSNRLAPGQGHIDFRSVFSTLKKVGYAGWGTVEILPEPDPDTAARQAIDYLKPLREEYSNA